MAGKIHPQRLLVTLKVLLSAHGGIKSTAEVDRLVPLMEKFSRKLVSRIIYINVLRSSSPDLLELFLTRRGWSLVFLWFRSANKTDNIPLRMKLLQLLLVCPNPPVCPETKELLVSIRSLTDSNSIKHIEMAVLALQVLSKLTSSSFPASGNINGNASVEPIKTVSEQFYPRPSVIRPLPFMDGEGRLCVSYQCHPREAIQDQFISNEVKNMADDDVQSGETLKVQCWSNERRSSLKKFPRDPISRLFSPIPQSSCVPAVKKFKVYDTTGKNSSKKIRTNDLASEVTSSIPKKMLKTDHKLKPVQRELTEKTDINKNIPKDQTETSTFLSTGRFFSSNDGAEKKDRTVKPKPSAKVVCGNDNLKNEAEYKEKKGKRKEIDEFKRKRNEEKKRKMERMEIQQKEKISFNNTEYQKDLDNESRSRIKEIAKSLKKEPRLSKSSVEVCTTETPKHKSRIQLKSKSNSKYKDFLVNIATLPTISGTSSVNKIAGIRELPKRGSMDQPHSFTSELPVQESKKTAPSTAKETLKEISLFDELDDELKKCREKSKSKLRRISRLSVSDNKSSVDEKMVELKKRVSWEKEEKLIQIKYFEVVEEERENVFKLKFEEKRKQDARNEKLKIKLASSLQSAKVSSSSSAAAVSSSATKAPGNQEVEKNASSWTKLISLDTSALKFREFGSKSEEKNVQETREAETPPFFWIPSMAQEPQDVDFFSQQRRSMVVSIKSILLTDVSGEGTVSDYSLEEWPRQVLQVYGTRSLSRRTSNSGSIPVVTGVVFKGAGKVPVPCIFWGRGYCRNEDKCRFLHEPSAISNATQLNNEIENN